MSTRISNEPDNFRRVFETSGQAVDDILSGRLEAASGTAIARLNCNRAQILSADLRARVIEHRIGPRPADQDRP